MIKLENVSTTDYIERIKGTYKPQMWYARKLLLENNITNYQQLKEFLESELLKEILKKDREYCLGVFDLEFYLKHIEYSIEEYNKKDKEAQIFSFDSPKISEIDDKLLNITDERNKGKILLCSSPIMLESGIDNIRKLSISQIKHLVGHVDSKKFKNCLSNLEGITQKKLDNIIRAIKFYDDQVIRQYFETTDREVNLFFLNKSIKKELTEEQIKEIAEYIVDNANECIWGKLTIEQKKKLLAMVSSSSGNDLEKSKHCFINAISRYTTLTELENGIINEQEVVTVVDGTIKRELKKPIDRFIIRRR